MERKRQNDVEGDEGGKKNKIRKECQKKRRKKPIWIFVFHIALPQLTGISYALLQNKFTSLSVWEKGGGRGGGWKEKKIDEINRLKAGYHGGGPQVRDKDLIS